MKICNSINPICIALLLLSSSCTAMEEKKDSCGATFSPFLKNNATLLLTHLSPLAAMLLENKLPSCTITKIICLVIPYIGFIIYTLEALYWLIKLKYIPINNRATLFDRRQQEEQISLCNLIKNQPTLKPIGSIARKLALNTRHLMVILGAEDTFSYFNYIGLEPNFNTRFPIKTERAAAIGHELCHIHDKVSYKQLGLHALIPLLTDCTFLCMTTAMRPGLPTAHVCIELLQKAWAFRILPALFFDMPLLHILTRYYEKKADLFSARLGKSAQAFSNFFYEMHTESPTKPQRSQLFGHTIDNIIKLLRTHPTSLDRARYLADIAINEQHARPCDLMVYSPRLRQWYGEHAEQSS